MKTVTLLLSVLLSLTAFAENSHAQVEIGGGYTCTAGNTLTLKGKAKTLKSAQKPIKNKIEANSNKLNALKGNNSAKAKAKKAALKAAKAELKSILKKLSDCIKGKLEGDPTPNGAWQKILGQWSGGEFKFDYAFLGELKFSGPLDMSISLNGPLLTIQVNPGGGFQSNFAGTGQFNIVLDVRDSKFTYPNGNGSGSDAVLYEVTGTPFGRLRISVTLMKNLSGEVTEFIFNVEAFDYPAGTFFNFYTPQSLAITVNIPANTTTKEIFASCVASTSKQATLRGADVFFRRP